MSKCYTGEAGQTADQSTKDGWYSSSDSEWLGHNKLGIV